MTEPTNEQVSIPASSVENSKENLFRLCEYNPDGQSGCRRTSTILALEAEYDTFVDPEMQWGYWDQYCLHEGAAYYYKGWLETNLNEDITELDFLKDNPNSRVDDKKKYISVVGSQILDAFDFEQLSNLFKNRPAGFPELTLETPQFFKCMDVGTDVITIDELDKTLLTKIQNTFTDNINPLLTDLTDKLHLVDGKVYCVDCLSFLQNPNVKLGVLMIAKNSEKYINGNGYFFPFSTLTAEQTDFVKTIPHVYFDDFAGEVIIINL